MFAILSRRSFNARNAYVCSSCLGHVDPTLVLPSRLLGPTSNANTSNNATFSTTAHLGEEGTEPGKEKVEALVTAEGNATQSPQKLSPRQRRRKREALLKSKGTSKVPSVLPSPRNIRKDISPKLENVSDSVETLDALRKSMMSEDMEGKETKETVRKTKTPASAKATKKAKPAPVVAKTIALPGGAKKASKVVKSGKVDDLAKDTVVKEKKALQKNIGKGVMAPLKIRKIQQNFPIDSNLEVVKEHLRSVQSSTQKRDAHINEESKDLNIANSKSKSPNTWAKKWIEAIASNQDGGSSFKRAILLKLIEKGNLSPKDVGPAVELLRNAIQEEQENRTLAIRESLENKGEFKSIRQAMQTDPDSPVRITRTIAKDRNLEKRPPRSSGSEEVPQDINTPMRGTIKHEIESINASDLKLVPLDVGALDVPKLAYGLERVLFNPGVYQLQDPRSRVFNFDPYLQTIMPVSEFDFSALKEYITSSRDTTLINIAKAEKRKYTGSTSSMTSALGHFHFLLSQWRPINAGMVSKEFPAEFSSFTALQRGPTAIFMRYKDGVYAIDADKEFDTANILSSLGKSMEKLLTLPTEDFEKYRKPNSDQITQEEREAAEAFHYTTMGDFLMRSQLDAYDSRLPGTGMFDLKTRAVVSIRMDTSLYEQSSGYEIKSRHGEWESFEREYYDMIRAAFLKYSLQVRMGRMDGIFVAFHNTERIFGFQYISLPEMDMALHGTDDTSIGDSEFKLSLDLLNRVLDRATAKFPGKSLRLFFETRTGVTPFMYIFAEPVEEKDIDKIQTSNKAEIDEFESRVLGLEKEDTEEQIRQAEWDSLYSKVEETMDQDESGVSADEEDAVDDQGADSGVWDADEIRQVEDFIKTAAQEDGTQDDQEDDEDNEHEEHDLEEVDDEDGEKEDGVTNDQDEKDVEENEEEDEHLEESDEHESFVDGQADEISQLKSHEGEAIGEVEGETSEIGFEADKEEIVQDDEFVPDEQENQLEEISEDKLDESLEVDQEVEETLVEPKSNINLEDHSEQTTTEEHEESGQSEDSDTTESPETISSDASDDSVFTLPTSSAESAKSATPPTEEKPEDQIFAMTLTIRNKVNDHYVHRPEHLNSADKWTVEYSLAEVKDPKRARNLYNMAKTRRGKTLKKDKDSKNNSWNESYMGRIMKMSKKGRAYRKKLDEEEKGREKLVLDLRDVSTPVKGL